jgi:hypothetical protein
MAIRTSAQWDEGADGNLMSEGSLRQHGINPSVLPLRPAQSRIQGIAGSSFPMGRVEVALRFGKRELFVCFLVVREDLPLILRSRARTALGVSLGGFHLPDHAIRKESNISGDADRASLFDVDFPPLAEVPPTLVALLQANERIPAEAVCTHPMAAVRVDVTPGTRPHYEAGRRYPQKSARSKRQARARMVGGGYH